MYRNIMFTLCLLAVGSTGTAGEKTVSLKQESSGIKVLIGDDVFTVFRHAADRRKAFFYPIAAPGGFELLQKAVETQPVDSDSRKVVIASEQVALSPTRETADVVAFGTVLPVDRIEGNKIWIAGRNGWILRSDIMPLASIVTRLINDDPDAGKDRKSPAYYDHPHHKGLWFAVDEINGIKFWMEDSLVPVKNVEVVQQSGKTASFRFVSDWLDKADQPLLQQKTLVTISSDALISYDATLAVVTDAVHIGDTKEGMFAIRLAPMMPEKISKGPVTNAEGLVGTAETWGKTSRWINYVGPVLGNKFAVTIMDSTENPWKSRYHVRDYGLFSINPFGAGSYTEKTADAQPAHSRDLVKGDSLKFTYGIWIHGAASTPQEIEAAYSEFESISQAK